jgi:hypothetical protein
MFARSTWIFALIGLFTATPWALAQEAEGPNQGDVTVTAEISLNSAYVFRGLVIENEGANVFTNLGLAFDITSILGLEDNDTIDSVNLHLTHWNYLASAGTPAGAGGNIAETDYAVGISVGFLASWTFDFDYVAYTFPSGGRGGTVQELDWKLSLDDTGLHNVTVVGQDLGLHPYILVALELDGQADVGGLVTPAASSSFEKGVYLELGLAPSLKIIDTGDYTVNFTVPVVFGWGDDYYEAINLPAATKVSEDRFGFVKVGAHVSTGLPFMPESLGSWTLDVGVDFYFFGNSAQDYNGDFPGAMSSDGDRLIVGSVGLSMAY